VIAPGTGLGEAFLTWDETRYIPHSSEGGHADFAPTDERQIRLLQYMRRTLDHVSFEHVCSGIGIPHIYSFLRDVEKISENPDVLSAFAAERDASVVIIQHAFGSPVPSPLCAATIDMFLSILAGEAANLAVKVLATGGVYLAGGVVTHMLAALQRPSFTKSFDRKGRLAQLVSRIPLHAVLHLPGLTGAAAYGLEHLKGF
jgi:glucokinase